jgi:predicted O-linked N-acetylglucosamine transferase (SPINDLY family)
MPELETAISFHRQGRLKEADQAYRAVLMQQPRHFEALHWLGVLRLQQGDAQEAAALISKAVEQRPQALDALSNLAAALTMLNRSAQALAICDRILAAQPRDAETLFNRGVALMQLHRLAPALESFERTLAQRPDHLRALFNRGNMLAALERHAEALASYDRVLALNPQVLPAVQNRCNVLVKLGRCEEALAAFASLLARAPQNLDAQNGRAIALRELGRHDEALAACDQILKVAPNYLPALITRGNVLLKLERPADALANFERALAIEPNDVEAHNNCGLALHRLGRLDDALAAFDRALSISPDHRETLLARAAVLSVLNRPQEALASYERALTIKGDDIEALNQCALLFSRLRDFGRAHACYDRMLAIKPDAVEALIGKATIFNELMHFGESLAVLERALRIQPNDADLLFRQAYVHGRLDRLEEASAGYERVLAINPDHPTALGELAHTYLLLCAWDKFAGLAPELERQVTSGTTQFPPFVLLGFPLSSKSLSECTNRHVQGTIPRPAQRYSPRGSGRAGALRVAYLSANFCRHPVGYLIAGLFEHHDRSRIEPIGVSFGPSDDNSEIRARIIRSFATFHDVTALSDADAAAIVHDMNVDIAVDLMGHTAYARPGILAFRPAPIQVEYLGYPGPMNADFIDYVIADRIVLPAHEQPAYLEKIVHLPDSYQVNDSRRPIAERMPSRRELGLPEDAFVFCCFNQTWKITKPTFDAWMRIMAAVEGSVLWLLQANDRAMANLRREAQAQGVDPGRLIFAVPCEQTIHLARHRHADLILDTLPYNAHTTASDALWVGVPLVTCTGSTFAGRVAASLLHAVGLPELVTNSFEDYETLARKLATDRALLKSIVGKLTQNRLTHPLFDTARFARHIESAYETMVERRQRGEPPASFSVEPIDR